MPRKKIRMTGAEEAEVLAEAEGRRGKLEGAKVRKRTSYYGGSRDVAEKSLPVYDVVLERKYLGVRFAIVEIAPEKYSVEILAHPFPTGAGYPKISKHRYVTSKAKGLPKVYSSAEQAERCAKAAIRDVQVWFEQRGIALKRSRSSGRAKQTKSARARRRSGAIAQTVESPAMPESVRKSMRKESKKLERSREVRRLGKAGGKRALSAEMKRAQARLEQAQIEAQAKLLPKVMSGGFKQKGSRTVGAKTTAAELKRRVDADPKVKEALEDVRRIERAEGALAMEKRILDSGRSKNPTPAQHAEVGHAYLLKSQQAWERYLKSRAIKSLMDAHEALVVAHKELGYAKDAKGLKQAKQGLSAARAEIKSRMK